MPFPLLEAGQSPEPGKMYRLVETFSDVSVVHDPYTVNTSIDENTGSVRLDERKVGEGLMTLRGVFQRSDVKNANKRTYPRSIWEKWLAEKSNLMVSIRENRCCGQIEHPKDGVGILEDYACMVTGLKLEQDGTVIGEMKVLDTPKGRVIRDLVRSGVRVGVSSRGTGSVDGNGIVDERTFKPDTWDVVGNPSTPGAFPEVVESSTGTRTAPLSESRGKSPQHTVRTLIEGRKTVWEVSDSSGRLVRRFSADFNLKHPGEIQMQPKERFNELRTQVAALLASDVSESAIGDLTRIDTALTEASISLGTLKGQDSAFGSVIDDLQKQISEKRSIIATEATASKKSAKGAPVDEADDDEEDDDEEAGEEGDECESVDPAAQAEAIACLKEARATILALQEKVAAQEDAISELADKVAEGETDLAEAYEQLSAATAMIAEMTAVPGGIRAPIEEAIDEALTRTPALGKHRKVLERCESVAEVTELVESLTPRGSNAPGTPRLPVNESLPPIGGMRPGKTGGMDSLNEQTTPTFTNRSMPNPNAPRGVALVEGILRSRAPASING